MAKVQKPRARFSVLPNAYHSLSSVYELALDVAFDDAWLFFGLVLSDDCAVERLFGRFCSGHCQVDMGKPPSGNINLG